MKIYIKKISIIYICILYDFFSVMHVTNTSEKTLPHFQLSANLIMCIFDRFTVDRSQKWLESSEFESRGGDCARFYVPGILGMHP